MVAQELSEHHDGDVTITPGRPVALITGAGRSKGIAAAIATGLATDGWNIAFTYWKPYDDRVLRGSDPEGPASIASAIRSAGGQCMAVEADLESTETPAAIFD